MRLGRGWLLRELLKNVEFDNVLEVGCNWGNNLHILAEFGNGKQVYGIDPIEDILTGGQALLSVATAFALPFAQKAFDLVLCAGVLCHIAPERLAPALKEIERVCGKYALIIDYVADHEEAITFRGTHQLWKRDFTKRVGEETNLKLIIGGVTDAWDEKSLMKYTLWQRR